MLNYFELMIIMVLAVLYICRCHRPYEETQLDQAIGVAVKFGWILTRVCGFKVRKFSESAPDVNPNAVIIFHRITESFARYSEVSLEGDITTLRNVRITPEFAKKNFANGQVLLSYRPTKEIMSLSSGDSNTRAESRRTQRDDE
eukprot:TRINITY_DN8638_c0_g1_i1.p1 TRINITY_DN8638_c0_g1~~TRINITY_DN8638_c0_g1_i1.p1  ORF type:complete len:144 (-),score=12.88 TRINITY_DN8638_c0_g1_i1:241-672(-)